MSSLTADSLLSRDVIAIQRAMNPNEQTCLSIR
jgi:hypothetical protein